MTATRFWYISHFGSRYAQVHQSQSAERNLRAELLRGPVQAEWTAPPYEIVENKAWPDWMAFFVPLLSDRAVTTLRDLIDPYCQLLPWIREPGHSYTLVNITEEIPRQSWECESSSVYGDVIANADVIRIRVATIPHVFVLEGYTGKVFVSDELARRSVDSSLRGVAFVDPEIPGMEATFLPYRFGRRGTGFITRR